MLINQSQSTYTDNISENIFELVKCNFIIIQIEKEKSPPPPPPPEIENNTYIGVREGSLLHFAHIGYKKN